MKRIILPIVVVVVLVVGYGIGQFRAPKASAPVSITNPTVPSRPIEPNMPTGADGAVSTASQPLPVPSPKYWYGADRNEVGAGLEAAIKKNKEGNQAPKAASGIQPLDVQ
jgi:hypothetical protein